jgi:hypothetical protein
MLFRFIIPISSGQVGIESVGKFFGECRNKVIRYLKSVGRVHFQSMARKVGTINRPCCVSHVKRETGVHLGNGHPFAPRKTGVRVWLKLGASTRGADFPRCNEKREHIERADVRLPTWDPRSFFMMCDLGHGASHGLGGSLCFIWCGIRKGVSKEQAGALYP